MSIRVIDQALDRSQSKGTTRCVLVALADAAHHDGVTYLPQGPASNDRSIAFRANCGVRSVERAIAELVRLGELEVRTARRRKSSINVYRVVVGSIGEKDVEYDRIPFELDEPFSSVDDLAEGARSTRGRPPADAAKLAGSNGAFTPPTTTVHPANYDGFTPPKSADAPLIGDPSLDPSAAPVAAADDLGDLESRFAAHGVDGELLEQALAEPDRAGAWLDLAERDADLNVGGYFRAGFQRGGWPGPRIAKPAPKSALERDRGIVEQLVRNLGPEYGPDEARYRIDNEWDGLTTIERAELHELVDELVSAALPAPAVDERGAA